MYQPRRVADPIAPAGPGAPVRASRETDRFHQAPRHAAPTLADRVFARGGIALAVVTASATAGAVVVGSGADSAAATGGTPVLAPGAGGGEGAGTPPGARWLGAAARIRPPPLVAPRCLLRSPRRSRLRPPLR